MSDLAELEKDRERLEYMFTLRAHVTPFSDDAGDLVGYAFLQGYSERPEDRKYHKTPREAVDAHRDALNETRRKNGAEPL